MARGTLNVPAPALNPGIKPSIRDFMSLMGKALSGDMVVVVNPAVDRDPATVAAWTHTFYIELQTALGEIHSWFNKAIAAGVSIADTGGGTASIPSTTLTFVNGVATVIVSGTAATWAAGETFTLTVPTFDVLGYTMDEKTGVVTFATGAEVSYSASISPSLSPSYSPSISPSYSASISPSLSPSYSPSISPSYSPSLSPSVSPS